MFGKNRGRIGEKKMSSLAVTKSKVSVSDKVLKQSKSKKKNTWSDLENKELDKSYNELKKELQELRFQKVTSHLANPRRIRFIKRSIARVLTCKREKELNKVKALPVKSI